MDSCGISISGEASPGDVGRRGPSGLIYGEISALDDNNDNGHQIRPENDGLNHIRYPKFQRIYTSGADAASHISLKASSSHIDLHPELSIHPLLRPLLFWINPLIQIARTGNATAQDIWDAPEDAGVECNASRVQDAWRQAQNYIDVKCANADGSLFTNYFHNIWLRIPPFGRAIFFAYRREILIGALYQFCFAALQLTLPFIIGNVIAYLNKGGGHISYGISMVFALGVISTLSSYAIILTFYNMRRTGVCIKAGMMMATYQHALRLSVAARQTCSVGQTTNLMSIDCDKIAMASQYLHFLWHGPLVAVCVMGILCAEVGEVAAVIGVLFLLLLMPIQHKVALRVGTMRRRMVKFTDQRVKLTNEILQVIRIIKYYAWEPSVEQRVEEIRKNETKELWNYLVANGLLRELLFLAIPVSAFLIFSSYMVVDRPMSVVKVFRVLAYLNTLRFPMNLFGQAMKFVSDAGVSMVRLNDFFGLSTQPTIDRETAGAARAEIRISNASFRWQKMESSQLLGKDDHLVGSEVTSALHPSRGEHEGAPEGICDTFRLENIDVCIGPGELVAIIGPVGCGKSSLISAILGDMPISRGECRITGAVAYCAQTPWIQNMTLKENILFGQNCDALRAQYTACLDQAALLPDLSNLPDGDNTEIGERGINLSGGQKARVSFARALMAAPKSDIMIFDDPFSAVDRNTGEKMFFDGILRALSGKVCIVVLNSHMHLIPQFDRVIMMEEGKVLATDSPRSLLASSKFGSLFRKMTGLNDEMQFVSRNGLSGELSSAPRPEQDTLDLDDGSSPVRSTGSNRKKDGGLIAVEKKSHGKIDRSVYISYFGSCIWKGVATLPTQQEKRHSYLLIICILALFTGAQVMRVGVDLILVLWAQSGTSVYYTAYSVCILALALFVLLRMVALNSQAVRSSRALHKAVFRRVLAAPVPTFFDTHTVGEVLNRFGKDMEIVDTSIPEFFLQFLINWFQVASIFVLCIWSTPYFLLVAVPLIYVFYRIYEDFSCVSRDLKRLESISRTPVYASFSETLSGLDTIRAYNATDLFVQRHLAHMKKNQKISFHLTMCMCWVTCRLELMVSFVMFTVSLLAVLVESSMSGVGVGMALVYCLQLTALFQRCVQLSIDVQTYFTSAERILEYVAVPSEPVVVAADEDASKNPIHAVEDWTSSDGLNGSMGASGGAAARNLGRHYKEQAAWPTRGDIEFDCVVLKYRNNDPVLKGVSFKLKGGTRVGICGRTGAGKSTIMVALFRICSVSSGSILIDGVDTRTVPLPVLRRSMAIIPQDPVLFSGTVRSQLDPFTEYSDAEIWEVLEQVLMRDHVRGMSGGLLAEVSESGDNLSQGQRQLLCIARALLRKCRILVMDEATSAIDPATDAAIQRILKDSSVLHGTTVLTIAHRLQTCEDYDLIMTLSDGKVIEFDSPKVLLSNQNSAFYKMYHGK